jgi:hypothetical protein
LSDDEIKEYLVRLDKEVYKFKEELFRISWFMRGGVSVNDLMDRYSHEDLSILSEIIKENVENTKASQMPLL